MSDASATSAGTRSISGSVRADLIEDGRVLRLVLDQPKGNVLDAAMIGQLAETLSEHEDRRELKLVFFRGAGGQFSYGASVPEHRPELAPRLLATFHRLARQVVAYPVPVASLVEGSCLGGALELVLCGHFVFAARSARFGCPEIRLGVFPPVLAALGPYRLPTVARERLLLTGETVDAETARRLGLVTAVLDGGEGSGDPEAALLTWYREHLAPQSAFALRQGVRALRGSGIIEDFSHKLARTEAQYLEEVLASHDGNEGIEAFLDKRRPVWEDR